MRKIALESGRILGGHDYKKNSRFTDEQIVFALRQAESGTPIEEVCRKIGVSQQTFYRWKKKFGAVGDATACSCASPQRKQGPGFIY